MRFLVASVVVIMIFVLPAGSWYYLSSGYDYRVTLQEEVKVKESIEDLFYGLSEDEFQKINEACQGRYTVMHVQGMPSSSEQSMLDRLEDKYGGREGFQIKVLSQIADVPNAVRSNLSKYPDARIILIDDELNLRNAYSYSTEDIKKLIEHSSAILPIPKKQKVFLKRDLEKADGSDEK